ncbi:MAG: hypothetical protein K2J66_07960 [Muribaculaceae bacterium]|nr:hypothetical protein [Muribaculaceae bacterium]
MKNLASSFILFSSLCLCNCSEKKENNIADNYSSTENVSENVTKNEEDKTNTFNYNHLTFKGVPIDGTLKEFVTEMKKAGFSYIAEKNGATVLNGDFAGFKNCNIYVTTLHGIDIVNAITVIIPCGDDWSVIESNYRLLNELLTEKYEEPTEITEEFYRYSAPRSNQDKYSALVTDNCDFKTVYNTPKGKITVFMDHDYDLGTFLNLKYSDKINSDNLRSKVIDDL